MKTTVAIQTEPARVTENGVLSRSERMEIYQPKTEFKGGSIKWFDDSKLIRKK